MQYVIFLWSKMAYTVVLADDEKHAYEIAAKVGVYDTFDIVSIDSLSFMGKASLDAALSELQFIEFSKLF